MNHVREPFQSLLNDIREATQTLTNCAAKGALRKDGTRMPSRKIYVRDIRLTFEQPPIPMREWDWRAMRDGDDEETSRHGWGRTPVDALANLLLMESEWEDSLQTEEQRLLEEYP